MGVVDQAYTKEASDVGGEVTLVAERASDLSDQRVSRFQKQISFLPQEHLWSWSLGRRLTRRKPWQVGSEDTAEIDVPSVVQKVMLQYGPTTSHM